MCNSGFTGLDCSVEFDGSIPLGRKLARNHSAVARFPRIYVYDLPPPLSTWHFYTSNVGIDSDMGRQDGFRFIEGALRSNHRVVDPSEADYFIIPVAGGREVGRLPALEYIRAMYPYFNESMKKGVANHVMAIMAVRMNYRD